MKITTISILGCGYLGFPLALALRDLGYSVKGSTTTPEKIMCLKAEAIEPFLLNVDSLSAGNAADFFQSDVLVITLPFKKLFEPPEIYLRQMETVVSALLSSLVSFVLFTSSTSIYPELNRVITEEEPLEPVGERAQVLFQCEEILSRNKKFSTTVVRFAGLYGGTRMPGRFLAGENLAGGDKPVNLIHQKDAVAVLAEIIRRDLRGETLNACSDDHPSRKELYTQSARRLGLAAPQFVSENKTSFKIISNEKLKQLLSYRFSYPSPLAADI